MPVAVELNGLLPGRGPGRGPRCPGAAGRGAPGRGAAPGALEPPGRAEPPLVCGDSPCGPPGRCAPGRGAGRGPCPPPPCPDGPWPCCPGPAGRASGRPASGDPASGDPAGAPTSGTDGTGRGGTGRGAGLVPAASGAPEEVSATEPRSPAIGAGAGATWPTGALGAPPLTSSPEPWPGPRSPRCPSPPWSWRTAGAAARWAWRPGFAESPANCSLSLRTTGASIVDDAERTNSPIFSSSAMTALLSTPNSFASS